MRTLSVRSQSAFGGTVEVVAIRTSAARLRVAQASARDVSQWRKDRKAVAVINGGFFDPAGKPLGLRVSDGTKKNSLHNADWGVFFLRRDRAGVLRPQVMHTRDFKRQHASLKGISQAIQCGPRLVVAGKTTDLKPQTARRSGIGIQRDGKVVIAVADGGLPFADLAQLWAKSSGLNCRDALNLDGGGSTQLSLQTSKKSLEIFGAWPVPDVITIH